MKDERPLSEQIDALLALAQTDQPNRATRRSMMKDVLSREQREQSKARTLEHIGLKVEGVRRVEARKADLHPRSEK